MKSPVSSPANTNPPPRGGDRAHHGVGRVILPADLAGGGVHGGDPTGAGPVGLHLTAQVVLTFDVADFLRRELSE